MKDKTIFIIGIFISLIITVCSGFLFYKNQQSTVNSEQSTVTITTPVATQIPKVNYKDREIQVLNGSGKAGVAKSYLSVLSNLGYLNTTAGNYAEIITGNLLFAPTDFGKEINLENYKYQKSEDIKIVIGKK